MPFIPNTQVSRGINRVPGTIIDVRDYGAVCDGVANDAAAIQAAIDANDNYPGGAIVMLPGARIKVNSTIYLRSGIWLMGSGAGSEFYGGTATPVLALPTSGTQVDNIKVSNLTITSPSGGVGIKINISGMTGGHRLGWPRISIEDVMVVEGATGFLLEFIECRLINCVAAYQTSTGFEVGGTDNYVIGCTALESSGNGYLIGANSKAIGCKAYGHDGNGFELSSSGRIMLAGCEAQDNTGAGYKVASNTNTLAGCLADTNLRAGFEIEGVNNEITGAQAIYGGGGTGVTTRVGYLISSPTAKGNRIQGKARAIVPVGGHTLDNDIDVWGLDGAGTQVVTYAASVTPDPYLGEVIAITLTGNISIACPTHQHTGQRLTFELLQDGTGTRTVTFDSMYRTNWTPDTTGGRLNIISFEYDGLRWQQTSVATGLTAFDAGRADTFNRADGAIGTSSSGHTWETSMAGGSGSWQVVTNQAKTVGATGFANSYAVLDAAVKDYTLQCTITQTADSGLVWRYTNASNFVGWTGTTIGTMIAGVWTPIVTATWSGTKTLKVVVSGASFEAYVDGTRVATGADWTHFTATKAGMLSNHPDDVFDNFSIV